MITNSASTNHTGLQVLVAGGGIAGLSLAKALQDAGHHPLIIERTTEWPMTGTAHYLPANALRALNGLGVGPEVAAAAHQISRQRVTGSGGRTLVDLPVSSIWGDLGGCAAIRRSALHEILRAATADVPTRLGTTITAHLSDRAVRLSDGSVERYGVLVGADGMHSVVRTAGLGGAEPRPTGRWCWRFIADGWEGEDDTWHARLAPGRSLLTVPLGDGAVYCYADIATGNGRPPGDWRRYFDDFGGSITELLDQAGQAYAAQIMEVDQPYAVLGRMVLVGDAAHAMSPSMAQGIGLAVEDALVLTESLSNLPVYEALASYEQRRAPRIAWVRAQAHRRDSTRGLSPAVQDRVLRLTGRRLAVAGQRALLAMP